MGVDRGRGPPTGRSRMSCSRACSSHPGSSLREPTPVDYRPRDREVIGRTDGDLRGVGCKMLEGLHEDRPVAVGGPGVDVAVVGRVEVEKGFVRREGDERQSLDGHAAPTVQGGHVPRADTEHSIESGEQAKQEPFRNGRCRKEEVDSDEVQVAGQNRAQGGDDQYLDCGVAHDEGVRRSGPPHRLEAAGEVMRPLPQARESPVASPGLHRDRRIMLEALRPIWRIGLQDTEMTTRERPGERAPIAGESSPCLSLLSVRS